MNLYVSNLVTMLYIIWHSFTINHSAFLETEGSAQGFLLSAGNKYRFNYTRSFTEPGACGPQTIKGEALAQQGFLPPSKEAVLRAIISQQKQFYRCTDFFHVQRKELEKHALLNHHKQTHKLLTSPTKAADNPCTTGRGIKKFQ